MLYEWSAIRVCNIQNRSINDSQGNLAEARTSNWEASDPGTWWLRSQKMRGNATPPITSNFNIAGYWKFSSEIQIKDGKLELKL